ncbi:hypothetical protein CPB97_002913 [Podila verticillata]|nr:hypothetical protein CPB97_002913 [Podila verticillata]
MPPNSTNLQLHNITSQPFLDGTEFISQECNELSDPSDDDDDLGPEIYDDFVLLPPRPAARFIHASPSSIPSRIRTPYLPPEIIGLICLFSSPRTVVHSIQRVCRDWHAVALLYIGQKGLWRFRSQREEDELLNKLRLGRTNTLTIFHEPTPSLWRQRLDRTPPYDLWWPALDKFWRAVTVSSLEQDEESSTTTATPAMELQSRPIAASSLIQNIGKLVLQGQYTCDPTALLPMLPHLGRIHTLELNPVQCSRIPLFPILEHCLRLENLTIRSQQMNSLKIVWTIEDPGLETHLLGWTSSRLTFFDAVKVSTTYGVLSNLIGFCPDLRSLKVQDFYLEFPLPPLFPMRTPKQATILAQIRPLYRQAAAQCPNLEEFSVVPVSWSRLSSEGHNYHSYVNHVYEDNTRHSAHMDLTHEFFSHLRQATFTLTMPSPWQPTPALCDYLSRLTHLHVMCSTRHSAFNSQALDVILRCARSLVTLIVPEAKVCSTKYLYDHEVAKEFEALLTAKGISPDTKRARILYKRLNWEAARKYNAPIYHHHPHSRLLPHPIHWLCCDLQVVDIGVELGVSGPQVRDAEAMFRQLAHCCPLIEDLTIRSNSLHIGQLVTETKYGIMLEDESLLKQAAIRRRGQAVEDPLLSCGYYNMPKGYIYGKKIVYSRAQNTVLALGGGHRYEDFDGGIGASWQDMSMLTQGKLTRLRQLCFVVQAVHGELSVGEFEFLRTKNDARDRKHVKRAPKEVYWPRLEMFSILYQTAPKVIPTNFDKVDAKDSRPLVKKLEGLRPGVFFRVAHKDSV